MREIKKEHCYIKTFMGTTYDIGKPETIGEFKSALEQIIKDLPEDDKLEISEVFLKDNKIDYVLVDGIIQ